MPRLGKRLDLPHEQRPSWETRDRHRDLCYLGWGLRSFGRHPVSGRGQDGWSYTLILRGSPTLLLGQNAVRLAPGQAVLFKSSTRQAISFQDDVNAYAEVLIWIWRTPPAIEPSELCQKGYRLSHLDDAARSRVQAAHAVCREEVEHRDEFSEMILKGIRFQLDAEFARHAQPRTGQSEHERLAGLALRWLRQHHHQPNAIFLLRDYLQVSWATLDRLFRKVHGKSPSECRLELRMEKALELMKDGSRTRKQIAYELGYKHANDFSRAFQAYQRGRTGKS